MPDNKNKSGKRKSKLSREQRPEIQKTKSTPEIIAAHQQAEDDISKDTDLNLHEPNDDLDEGEMARLGKDKNNLV